IKFPLEASKGSKNAAAAESISFDVDFEAVFRELELPESFELYFIADSNGSIVRSGSSDHARPLRSGGWLNDLIAGESAEPRPARRIGDLSYLTEIGSAKKPFEQFKGGTTQLRIDLAGVSHYVYVQPLNLPITENGKEAPGGWFLGGAVSYDEVL